MAISTTEFIVVGTTIDVGSSSVVTIADGLIDASGALAIAGTAATSITIGRSGITTTFLGTDSITILDGTLSLAALGGRTQTTDTATVDFVITSMDAYAQATTNVTGADLILAGGIGKRIFTITDYSVMSTDTLAVVVNGSSTTLTEGTDFDAVTDNNTTATNLATAVDGVTGVSAVAVAAVVYITADISTYSLRISTGSDGATSTSSADGAPSAPAIGANSEAWGLGASATGNTSLAVGDGATANVTAAEDNLTAVGQGAVAAGDDGSAFGTLSFADGASSTALGTRSRGAQSSVAVGSDADGTGANCVLVGAFASGGAFTSGIAISRTATLTANNQAVFGSGSAFIETGFIGAGVVATNPRATMLWSTTGGSGTDVHATDLILASGRSTGAGAVTDLIFQTPDVLGTGATLQTLVTRLTIGSTLSTFTTPTTFTQFVNVGSATSAVALGDLSAGDGTNELFWNPSTPAFSVGTTNNILSYQGNRLRIRRTDVGTNDEMTVLDFERRSTGTVAVGFGSRIQMTLDDNTGQLQNTLRLRSLWEVLPVGAGSSELRFNLFSVGSEAQEVDAQTLVLTLRGSDKSARIAGGLEVGTSTGTITGAGDIVAGNATNEFFWNTSAAQFLLTDGSTTSSLDWNFIPGTFRIVVVPPAVNTVDRVLRMRADPATNPSAGHGLFFDMTAGSTPSQQRVLTKVSSVFTNISETTSQASDYVIEIRAAGPALDSLTEIMRLRGADLATVLAGGLEIGTPTTTAELGDFSAGDGTRDVVWDTSLGTFTIGSAGNSTASCPGAGTNSEKWGDGASAVGANSTALGANASAPQATTENNQTALGASTIASGDASTAVGYSADATGVNSIALGVNAQSTGANSTALGSSTTSSGTNTLTMGQGSSATGVSCIAIGVASAANTGGTQDDMIAIGTSAVASGDRAIAIGFSADSTGNFAVGIGYQAQATGILSVAMGHVAEASGENSVALGAGSNAGHNESIVLGSTAASTAVNQFVVGSSGDPIRDVFMGEGVTSATPGPTLIFNVTGGSGTNIVGSSLVMASGKGTGDSVVSDFVVQTPDVGSSGTTLQTLVTRLTINESGAAFSGPISAATVTAGDIEVTTISANDGTLAQTLADSTGVVTFAAAPTSLGGGATSERWGAGSLAAGAASVSLGRAASSAGDNSAAFGSLAASAGANAVAFGASSSAAGAQALAVGRSSNIAHDNSIGFGFGSTSTAASQLIVGAFSAPITTIYIGEGVTSATPSASLIFNATGGTGTNIVGTNLVMASGRGTGDSVVSDFVVQTPDVGSSGTVAQTLVTRLTLNESGATFSGTANATISDGVVNVEGITWNATPGVTHIVGPSGEQFVTLAGTTQDWFLQAGVAVGATPAGNLALVGGSGASGGGNPGSSNLTGGAAGSGTNDQGGSAGATGGSGDGSGTGGTAFYTGGTAGITGVGGRIQLLTGVGGATSGASGVLSAKSGTTTDGDTGDITIQTGNALGSGRSSGDTIVDVGTSPSTTGEVIIGATNASAVNIGRSGQTVRFEGTSDVTILDGTVTADEIVLDAANADAFISYDGGPGDFAFGTTSGGIDGDLRARRFISGTSFFRLADGGLELRSANSLVWSSTSAHSGSKDLGLFRLAPEVMALGDGTAGDSSATLSLAALGGRAQTTDTATVDFLLTGMDAVPDSTASNTTGGDLVLAGGIPTSFVTIIDYTQVADTITVTVDGSDTALVENTDFNGETSNDQTATNLAVAIDAISGVSATATAAVVNITPDVGTRTLALAETGVLATVSDNVAGQVLVPAGEPAPSAAPGLAFERDRNTGFQNPAIGFLDIIAGGAIVARFTSGSLQIIAARDLLISDDSEIIFGSGFDVFQQGELTSLTDGSASTVFSVVMGDGDMAGIKIDYTIQMTDGTEHQSECGTVHIAIVDDAGGVVASTPGVTKVQALSSGTLTTTWTVVTTDDQSIEIQVNANSSLTTTTSQIRWLATCSGDVTLSVP